MQCQLAELTDKYNLQSEELSKQLEAEKSRARAVTSHRDELQCQLAELTDKYNLQSEELSKQLEAEKSRASTLSRRCEELEAHLSSHSNAEESATEELRSMLDAEKASGRLLMQKIDQGNNIIANLKKQLQFCNTALDAQHEKETTLLSRADAAEAQLVSIRAELKVVENKYLEERRARKHDVDVSRNALEELRSEMNKKIEANLAIISEERAEAIQLRQEILILKEKISSQNVLEETIITLKENLNNYKMKAQNALKQVCIFRRDLIVSIRHNL